MKLTPSRIAGALYLVPMVLGPFSMLYVPSQVLVTGDAAATAQQLGANEALFRLGLASDLVIVLSEVALTAVLFGLFHQAGRALALTAAAARFLMAGVQAVNVVVNLAALQAVSQPGAALWWLQLHAQAVHAWEALFALHLVLLAVLLARGGHRAMGGLAGLAGLGYGLNAFGSLVAPSMAPVFAAVVGLTAVVGEVPFVFWLLLRRAPLSEGAGLRPA